MSNSGVTSSNSILIYSGATFCYSTGFTVSVSNWNSIWNWKENELDNLTYNIHFDYDEDDYLHDNILGIDDNVIKFENNLVPKNRLQPYELIMTMIKNQIKFNIEIHISDLLIVKYFDVQFKKIKNNFTFDAQCSFSKLNVEFEFLRIDYENIKMDISEKRKDKLTKIFEYENINEK